jgi:tetratricopeptide (TPR) repeat protein
MPINAFPADQAMANLRGSRSSLWPERWRGQDRLKGVAQVEFSPSFRLEPGEAVMTIGSCFARNIEARLAELGFDIPARAITLPAEERASDTENDLLNKYTPQSVINELRWAFEPTHRFRDDSLLEAKGQWHDPHLAPNVAPSSLERVRERRAMVTGLYRQLPHCRVVVLTLGLVEVWLDTRTGLYLNGPPPTPCTKQEPDRFRLEVLSHADILTALDELYGLLRIHGHPEMKLLVTVSPVPLRATFSGQDALIANTYSKATLRSAVGEFIRDRPDIDYFPSYEIATLTLRTTAFQEDNRHVAPALVDAIVDRVVSAYCEGGAKGAAALPDEDNEAVSELDGLDLKEAGLRLKAAIEAGDRAEALKLFAYLDEKDRYTRARLGEYYFRKHYGLTLAAAGSDIKALGQLERAVAEQPNSAATNYELGRLQTRLQRPREAEASFRRALQADPGSSKYRQRLVARLMDNGGYEEAARELARLVEAEPSDERFRTQLAEARAKAGGEGGLLRKLAKRLGG